MWAVFLVFFILFVCSLKDGVFAKAGDGFCSSTSPCKLLAYLAKDSSGGQ